MARDLRKAQTSPRIVRFLPDGMAELEFANGRRIRTFLARCCECQVVGDVGSFKGKHCLECYHRIEAEKRKLVNEELERTKGAQWAIEAQMRAAQLAAIAAKNRGLMLRAATPHWANKEEIEEIYKECRKMTGETGVVHHVDHIWPLSHSDCCGLHVPWNLRIIKGAENSKKNNRLPDGRRGSRRRV